MKNPRFKNNFQRLLIITMFTNNSVERLLKKTQIPQLTAMWFEKRHDMLTATECSSALEANPFFKKFALLKKKCQSLSTSSSASGANANGGANANTSWGLKYESIASDIYSKLNKKKVYNLGFLTHDTFSWLGASPDGLIEDGRLLEIKCVVNRTIDSERMPYYYWIQVQIQMEVADVDECDFFQCKFVEYESEEAMKADVLTPDIFKGIGDNAFYWKLEKCTCKTVVRDKNWFNVHLPALLQFYKDMLHYREVGLPDDEERERSGSGDSVVSVYNRTRLGTSRNYVNHNWNDWVSATDIKNYIMDDPILDWYNLYANCNGIYPDKSKSNYNFNEFIMSKGLEFEKSVLSNLEKRFGPSLVKVANIYEGHSIKKFRETVECMERGVPMISNAILHNATDNTFGIADLIVRSDYINKIVSTEVLNSTERVKGCKFSRDWHYRVIDFKFTTLDLFKSSDSVRSKGNIKAYKSQVIIYNKALGHIQSYTPSDCYLLGRRVKKCGKKYGTFHKLGVVSMSDRNMLDKVNDAVKWVRELRNNGASWELGQRSELKPNMCNKNDYPWHSAKKKLADEIKELTQVWNIGINDRKVLNGLGVSNSDGISMRVNTLRKKRKYCETIDSIVNVNRSESDTIFMPDEYDLTKIGLDKKEDVVEFYVDFETTNNLNDSFDSVVNYRDGNNQELGDVYENVIYMIGIGWIDKETGEWKFENFIVNRLSLYEERKIIKKFFDILDKYPKYKVYHWSNAEPMLLKKALKRVGMEKNVNWFDLLKVFKKLPITVRGSYSFGLKSVAKSMFKHGLIKTNWEDSNIDGLDAMLVSWFAENECRSNNIDKLSDYKDMDVIVRYNEIDCKAMWDILKFLRNKWTK